MAATFDNDAELMARHLSDASAALAERDQLKRTGGNVLDANTKLRGALSRAEKQLEKISSASKAAEAASTSTSQKELQRRRDIVRRHQTELQRLRGLEKNAVVLSDRDALLGSAGGSGKGADAGAERATPGQLQTRIENEFKQQDEIIGNMSKGLDNLKSIGLAIRDETDLHMKLLDNLEDSVDKGNAALKRETARADHITAETRSCWLYMTICILLVVLIGLVCARYA